MDPRRPDKVVPFDRSALPTPPNTIESQATMTMMLSGGAMIMRQKLIAWIALATALSAVINAGSLFETTPGGQTPLTLLIFSLTTVGSTYMPMLLRRNYQ